MLLTTTGSAGELTRTTRDRHRGICQVNWLPFDAVVVTEPVTGPPAPGPHGGGGLAVSCEPLVVPRKSGVPKNLANGGGHVLHRRRDRTATYLDVGRCSPTSGSR